MTRKRRNHSPEFKAAKGDKTVAELTQKYNLHESQISTMEKGAARKCSYDFCF
ncbi:hypothetical protein THF1D04_450006 [Vibrio owensii]|uniref:Transposase n=1 Tax=Vibrio owensii TaxID=696485 RepID=A0AAU9QAD6_9VIBR|nr:hypothetical protein THF1D04_450006 [Vibrio owensii]